MLLKTVNPEYPAELRKARITGVVVISYCVRPDGSVTDLEVKKSAHPALDRLALEAVSQWKFTPYSPRDGQLVHLSNPIAFAID
jgi:TonB family protein